MKNFIKKVVEGYKKLGYWGFVIENIVILAIGLLIFYALSNSHDSDVTNEVVSISASSGSKLDSAEYVLTDIEKDLISAVDKLDNIDNYIVTTYIEEPSGDTSYIEVIDNGKSYTKIPTTYTADGDVMAYQEKGDDGYFILSDYIDKDGTMYIIDTSVENYQYYIVPESYATDVRYRDTLFLRRMFGNMYNVEYIAESVVDVGNGEEVLDVYEFDIPSTIVRDIMCSGSYSLYYFLREDNPDNEGLNKLMSWYLDSLDLAMTFSDGVVTVGVDKEGVLKYVNIECGGIGQLLDVTKCVVLNDTSENVIEPDVSNAIVYVDAFKEMSEIASQFDTMEEAIAYMSATNAATADVTGDYTESILDDLDSGVIPNEGEETDKVTEEVDVDTSDTVE